MKSLLWTYVSYSVALVLSIVINDGLTHYMHVNVSVAWVVTLLSTGVINYFALQKAYEPSMEGGKKKPQ